MIIKYKTERLRTFFDNGTLCLTDCPNGNRDVKVASTGCGKCGYFVISLPFKRLLCAYKGKK